MLKYALFTSEVEFPFWAALARQKIENDKLDDTARRIVGLYEVNNRGLPEASCRIQVHGDALTSQTYSPSYYRAEGIIKNVNTIEEFRNLDKATILSEAGLKVLNAIDDGSILSNPSSLASFVIICFADIKKYKFTYLFGFPALQAESAWRIQSTPSENATQAKLTPEASDREQKLDHVDSEELSNALAQWRQRTESDQIGFFLVRRRRKQPEVQAKDISRESEGSLWEIGTLKQFEAGFFHEIQEEDRFFGFADPSTFEEAPGWLLRNFLMLISRRWKLQNVQLIRYQDVPGERQNLKPTIMRIETESPVFPDQSLKGKSEPKITGWERNTAGKIVSRTINVGDYLDPSRLADQAVDLNLKLMRWRIAPTLNLDKIKGTKCLLLGAGTLGCYVSRNLLGWGVKKITFVDNGNVSYSNPVRQPLYKQADCLNGGVPKAHQAANALREIYPGVDAEGHVLSVPMAGHPTVDETKTKSDFDAIRQLILDHDAIFQLMDSRESRWLPTLIGKSSGKIVLNAALGFDSFVAMRHGARDPQQPGRELGCYFCNDVVAPIDSLSERTLDQQCTVTRPGIAAIASGILVEIFVNLLQHPLGSSAPASGTSQSPNDSSGSELGIVPHQVRGFLSSFQNLNIQGKAYDHCSACSDRILKAYEDDPWGFVSRALNEKGFVEEISGLAEVQAAAEKALMDMDAVDELDEEDDDEIEIL